MSAAESVVSQIQHYQKSIQKYHGNSIKILHCINRLYNLPVSVQHLQDTGVGKTINSLRKSDGDVGESARALVAKWKQMVEEESENEVDSNVNRKTHSNCNGDSEAENNRERSDKRSKENYIKSRDHDSREHSRSDHSKSQKRRRESESDQSREKRPKSDKVGSSSSHSSSSHFNTGGKLNGNIRSSDEEWNGSRHNNGEVNSEDENNIQSSEIKNERAFSEERNAQFSDDDLNKGDFLTSPLDKEPWHNKEDDKPIKKEKTSHKHKHKSSSSNSEKSKHTSSSRSEYKESKSSSSSKHRDEKSSASAGSSNSRKEGDMSERTEDRSKTKDKDKKDKHKHKHHSKDEKKSKERKEKKEDGEEDGVNSNSGIGFGEALGMMFPPDKPRKKSSSGASSSQSPSKKKSKSYSSVSEKRSHVNDDMNFSPEVDHESPTLNLEVDEDFGLPALNPNYKPLPQPNFFNSPPKRYQNDDEDDLTNIMYNKVQRTKVFSGNKTGYSYVPSLFNLCTRVLQENIDALEYTGGVPFEILKPVLERATPNQLYTLEHYNAYLIEDTDKFWEYHCKKDFRTKKREEMETWREMYMRCREERETKLKSLTANITAAAKAKLLPVRKTQLAYVESSAKPPRNIARKQAKYGTGQPSTSSASRQDSSGLSSSFTGRSSTAHSTGPAVAVPAPRGAGGSSNSSSCKPKPKAPLMQKALQLIKYNRFKR